MWERNVVSAIVITTIASVGIERGRSFGTDSVLGLPNPLVMSRKAHSEILRLFPCNLPGCSITGAVLTDTKVLLDFLAHDREFARLGWLFPACMIVASENLDLLIFFVLSKHRVNEEDGRLEFTVNSFRVDWLSDSLVHGPRLGLVITSHLLVSDSSSSFAH
jgi:hypothetical protein